MESSSSSNDGNARKPRLLKSRFKAELLSLDQMTMYRQSSYFSEARKQSFEQGKDGMAVILSRRAQESGSLLQTCNRRSTSNGSSIQMVFLQVMAVQRPQKIPKNLELHSNHWQSELGNLSRGPSNDGKTLYPTQGKGKTAGERMASTYSSSQKISIYTSDSFLGREAVDNRKATRGMTDWVAKNFELLDLGEAPYESRQVDSLTRARWQQFTMEVLERWIAPHATRHVIRRTLDGRDGPMFMMFPHPEDALGMNLQGRNGETALCPVLPH